MVFPLKVLRKLYSLCRNANFDITVTLVYRGSDWVVTDVEGGDTTARHYGLAVDYGSTTVIMQLIDLNSGAVIGEESAVSGQVAYGTDILTRITYALESSEHVDALQRATVSTFQQLLDKLTENTGIPAKECPVMIVSGNTTMVHFLLGLDIHKKEKASLFFDIGTNGELVIGNRDWMIAGAGAAGPALEGYISKFGMRAAPGAIDSVKIQDGRLTYTTLGGQNP